MEIAPIVLFVYARPDHAARALEALAKNDLASQSRLYVYADGPRREEHRKGCEETRKVLDHISGFKEVIVHKADKNIGCANSIIMGVENTVKAHGKAIVVEDDLVSVPFFLTYMNEGLVRYANQERVFSICGYAPPMRNIPKDYPYDAFFAFRNMAWGWATWVDKFKRIDWEMGGFEEFLHDKKAQRQLERGGPDMIALMQEYRAGGSDAWDVRWDYSRFVQKGLALLPVHSLIHNIGADGSGTHFTNATDQYAVDLSLAKPIVRWPIEIEVDPRMERIFASCYRKTFKRGVKKALRIVKSALGAKR